MLINGAIRMKDPIRLLLALMNLVWGISSILFPQWYYRKVSADQIARDRRVRRVLGCLLVLLGLLLLITYVRP